MTIVRCAACQALIPDRIFREGQAVECPSCERSMRSVLLPALYRSPLAAVPEAPGGPPGEGETACFYDPARKATGACDHCGVFVSEAWSAKWGTQTVCLKCLDQLRSKTKDQRFEGSRKLWDNIALGAALGPYAMAAMLAASVLGLIFISLPLLATAVTAPAAIFIAIRFWSAPRSLVPRGVARLVIALTVSLLTIAAWVIGLVVVFESIGR